MTVVDLTCFDGIDEQSASEMESAELADGPLSPSGAHPGQPPPQTPGDHSMDPNVYQPASIGGFNQERTRQLRYRMCHLPEFVSFSSTGVATQVSAPKDPSVPSSVQPNDSMSSMRSFPQDAPPLAPSQQDEPLLAPVKESCSIVHDALCEALGMPAMLRLPYMLSINRLLMLKGVTLLKLIQSDVDLNFGSTEATGKWLRDNLGLASDVDLNVVFSFAEKICPGVCANMMTDRLTFEETFIELFEGFV